jgi:hypothetical protein
MTWQQLGPYPIDGLTPEPIPLDILPARVTDQTTGLTLDMSEVRGVLTPFNGRARTFLLALLRGASRTRASMAAGVDIDTVRAWEKREEEFRKASSRCANLGFASVFEAELESRAMAGPDDRGSMRALELVVKARGPEYREKSQLAIDVQVRAQEATHSLGGGWQHVISAPDQTDNA